MTCLLTLHHQLVSSHDIDYWFLFCSHTNLHVNIWGNQCYKILNIKVLGRQIYFSEHYLNQCWHLINWNLMNKFQQKSNLINRGFLSQRVGNTELSLFHVVSPNKLLNKQSKLPAIPVAIVTHCNITVINWLIPHSTSDTQYMFVDMSYHHEQLMITR